MNKFEPVFTSNVVINSKVRKNSKKLLETIFELFYGISEAHICCKTQNKLITEIKETLSWLVKEVRINDNEIPTKEMALTITENFIKALPTVKEYLDTDIEAIFNCDPACEAKEVIVAAYPGFYALFTYRIAHILYESNVKILPRILTEIAHSKTGIDINAGAKIGKFCAIDHGTGIVIGETTEIGEHVTIYQGVTLGALSTRGGQALKGVKRHPTIKDYVTIYANATILGGNTVIDSNLTIKANEFITKSISKESQDNYCI